MKITDKELLRIYHRGWTEENDIYAKRIKAKVYVSSLKQSAYNWGRSDYVLGDDISSVDLQTKEQILEKIRKK